MASLLIDACFIDFAEIILTSLSMKVGIILKSIKLTHGV